MESWIVLFDWDGTLITSLDLKVQNAAALFAGEFQVSPQAVEKAYRRYSGIPRQQLFNAICWEIGLPVLDEAGFQVLSAAFTRMNRETMERHASRLAPADTTLALEALAARGCPLYVSSSADPEEIRAVARMVGLQKYFCEILGSTPGFRKGKEHVEYVQRRYGPGNYRIAFVGDEPADVRLGREAGALTIAKTGTCSAEILRQERPDRIITSLLEIPTILLEEEGS
jgi:phosphoglycolate phosphatase-like HAD superfamily hydrolase